MRPVYFPPQDLERDTGLRSCNPRLGYREVRMKGSFSGSPELEVGIQSSADSVTERLLGELSGGFVF